MVPIFLIALGALAASPKDHPTTYLVSIEAIPLRHGDSIEMFELDTWGVTFNAVCHIPGGWWIEAGGSATPEGSLKGRGSLGATWLDRNSMKDLHNLVLITLYGPIRKADIRDTRGDAIIPATFKGRASIEGRSPREVKLTYANVRLVPAKHCPA